MSVFNFFEKQILFEVFRWSEYLYVYREEVEPGSGTTRILSTSLSIQFYTTLCTSGKGENGIKEECTETYTLLLQKRKQCMNNY